MTRSSARSLSRLFLPALVTATGFASLSWEILWQIKSSLALGVSAWGTAVTLVATMGGMSAGSLCAGRLLKERSITHPARIYGVMEIIIGIAGLLLGAAFHLVEQIDSWSYSHMHDATKLVHILSIIAVLGVPAFCMGATLPVFGLLARRYRMALATLYGLNTLGAAAGTLLAAFFCIPQFGLTGTGCIIAAVNFSVGVLIWLLPPGEKSVRSASEKIQTSTLSIREEQVTVFITGFATFALEIAWFRSLTAAFHSTTVAFAVMLSALLAGLGIAAGITPMLRKMKIRLGTIVVWAGFLVLAATPIIERFDFLPQMHVSPDMLVINWLIMTLIAVGLPVLFLGIAFPWILDSQHSPRAWGRLYAINTLAAILGSVGAAWILLPMVGFARTAWISGGVVLLTGICISPPRLRMPWSTLGVAGLILAVMFESGAGRTRVQGYINYGTTYVNKILKYYEGPDATVSAVEYNNGGRALIIDGFITASQLGPDALLADRYMVWMGRLPMLLTPHSDQALVICFGTGQTANAVREEGAQSLDIVDVNPRVFKLAPYFTKNKDVLNDVRVHPVVMDGRAYMRRTTKQYDVITLEPMPPNFAGVNALYDKEFYELARARLTPHGVIAQWLPFHLVSGYYAASIARTFQSVFPNSILWLDPNSKTGILLGSRDDDGKLGGAWPGFSRKTLPRELPEAQIRKGVWLNRKQMAEYAAHGAVITDDNQLLAYGRAVETTLRADNPKNESFLLINRIRDAAP